MNIALLLQLTKGVFLIEPQAAQAYKPLIDALFNRGKEDLSGLIPELNYNGPLKTNLPFFSAASGASQYPALDAAPKGSISITPVKGAIMKNDFCGSPGTQSMMRFMKAADEHPNIIGHVIEMDSPGGAADGWLDFSNGIKAMSKPVVAWVDGYAASAAYGIASAAKEIIASNEMSRIGSIGTYISMRNYSKYYESMGIEEITVYADASTEKNGEYRELLQGNDKPMRENMLNPINSIFLKSVERNRFSRNLDTEAAFTGKLFFTKEAKAKGLIDGVGSFEYALQRVQKLSKAA